MSQNAVNSGQTLAEMVTNVKFFSYLFSSLLTLMLLRLYWRFPYWQCVLALSLTGMLGTFLETLQTSVLIPQGYTTLFRVSVIVSECCWFINEASVVIISYLRSLPLLIFAPFVQKCVKYAVWVICPIILALRMYVCALRFARVQSVDHKIGGAQRPYFLVLAITELCFSALFIYYIIQYHRIRKQLDLSVEVETPRKDRTLLLLQISSAGRLLLVNVIMILLAAAFFLEGTSTGAYLLDITACFKFNFGTFFLVDLILLRQP
jgi:hypothetical protein